MNNNYEDLTDQEFDRLTARSVAYRKGKRTYWSCECSCGGTKIVRSDSLKDGSVRSCGCLKKEQDWINLSQLKHGEAKKGNVTSEHRRWGLMRNRCTNPKSKSYKRYGARGIKVCERWNTFENFLADMGRCPPGCSLDRVNNDGDYCPENCRWANATEQANNRRTNVKLTIDGRTENAVYWAKKYNLRLWLVLARKHRGLSDQECVSPTKDAS